ncbi:MAG: OsmC family protein [Chitinophagaceae bacterium]
MATNKIISTHISGMSFLTELDGHPIHIDMSIDKEGADLGPRPKALMLVSLAGCTGLDVVMILNKMRVEFSNFKIGVEGELTETDPKIYHKVTLSYSIKVADKDKKNVEKAIDLSQDKYCGVSAMFRAFATMETEINYE